MKGPFERLKYDLRRIWECPQCGAKQRTDGSATTRFCYCGKPNSNPPVGMKLVGDGPRRMVPTVAPPRPEAPEAAPAEAVPVEVLQVDVIADTAEASIAAVQVDVLPAPIEPTETTP